jgi:metal-sulfur cluster biosynthetic enzyme
MAIVLHKIEDFEIGDQIRQSGMVYEVKSKDDVKKRVHVESVKMGFTVDFEYGSEFILAKAKGEK